MLLSPHSPSLRKDAFRKSTTSFASFLFFAFYFVSLKFSKFCSICCMVNLEARCQFRCKEGLPVFQHAQWQPLWTLCWFAESFCQGILWSLFDELFLFSPKFLWRVVLVLPDFRGCWSCDHWMQCKMNDMNPFLHMSWGFFLMIMVLGIMINGTKRVSFRRYCFAFWSVKGLSVVRLA